MYQSRTLIRTAPVIGLLTTLFLGACHVQWVSPYSADLQKRATDMLVEVAVWEGQMRSAAGTAAADPRNSSVQAKLLAWRGDIEAMSEIELSIDPGSTSCDRFLAVVGGDIPANLKAALPYSLAATSSSGRTGAHCETLPGIFSSMMKQVSGDTADNAGIPFILEQQCKLPWLPDGHFAESDSDRGALTGASARPSIAAVAVKAEIPSVGQKSDAVARCRSLFEPPPGRAHGNLVDPLVTDLDAIIYREGRQAPTGNK